MENRIKLLIELRDYLLKLREGIKSVYDNFQFENVCEGAQILTQCIEGIQWVIETMILTSDIHDEVIDIDEINGKLMEIVEAFSNEDYVLIGDLFEYELSPIFDRWQNVIEQLLEKRK